MLKGKKFISILLAAIMLMALAVTLGACGEDDNPDISGTDAPALAATAAPGEYEIPEEKDAPDPTEAPIQHTHIWTDATCTLAKTCSECGETEGEPLGHTLSEATYFAPAACTVCGETEGNAKPNYFETHNIPLADAPSDFTQYGAIGSDTDTSYFRQREFPATIKEWKVEADSKEGYKKITFAVAFQIELIWRDDSGKEGYNAYGISHDFFDLYTGLRFTGEDIFGPTSNEYSMTIELDGTVYEITYTEDFWSDWEDWIEYSDGNATCKVVSNTVYVFHVPEAYDGLVYCAEATSFVGVKEPSGEDLYAAELERLSEAQFFRLNK